MNLAFIGGGWWEVIRGWFVLVAEHFNQLVAYVEVSHSTEFWSEFFHFYFFSTTVSLFLILNCTIFIWPGDNRWQWKMSWLPLVKKKTWATLCGPHVTIKGRRRDQSLVKLLNLTRCFFKIFFVFQLTNHLMFSNEQLKQIVLLRRSNTCCFNESGWNGSSTLCLHGRKWIFSFCCFTFLLWAEGFPFSSCSQIEVSLQTMQSSALWPTAVNCLLIQILSWTCTVCFKCILWLYVFFFFTFQLSFTILSNCEEYTINRSRLTFAWLWTKSKRITDQRWGKRFIQCFFNVSNCFCYFTLEGVYAKRHSPVK